MQVNISTRHGHISPTTQERITERVERIRRFFDRLTAIEVTVDLEHRETPHVELRVSAEHTADFIATQVGDLMAAVDGVSQKMEQQLRKHKEKVTGHRATSSKYMDSPDESEHEAETDTGSDED